MKQNNDREPLRWRDIVEGSGFDEKLKIALLKSLVCAVAIDDDNQVYTAGIVPDAKDKTLKGKDYNGLYKKWTVIIKVYGKGTHRNDFFK